MQRFRKGKQTQPKLLARGGGAHPFRNSPQQLRVLLTLRVWFPVHGREQHGEHFGGQPLAVGICAGVVGEGAGRAGAGGGPH